MRLCLTFFTRLFSEFISVYSANLFPFIQRIYFRFYAAFFAVLTQRSALNVYAVRTCTYVWETAYYETRLNSKLTISVTPLKVIPLDSIPKWIELGLHLLLLVMLHMFFSIILALAIMVKPFFFRKKYLTTGFMLEYFSDPIRKGCVHFQHTNFKIE